LSYGGGRGGETGKLKNMHGWGKSFPSSHTGDMHCGIRLAVKLTEAHKIVMRITMSSAAQTES